jgi:hypothetical protein
MAPIVPRVPAVVTRIASSRRGHAHLQANAREAPCYIVSSRRGPAIIGDIELYRERLRTSAPPHVRQLNLSALAAARGDIDPEER